MICPLFSLIVGQKNEAESMGVNSVCMNDANFEEGEKEQIILATSKEVLLSFAKHCVKCYAMKICFFIVCDRFFDVRRFHFESCYNKPP